MLKASRQRRAASLNSHGDERPLCSDVAFNDGNSTETID